MAYRYLSKTSDDTKINRSPGMGGRNLGVDTYAWNYNLPCRNPNCKSHGKPHPNCQCYGGGGEGDYAKGGEVHFCSQSRMHLPGCIYYSEGGEVKSHHFAGVHHGLLGLLKDAGHAKIAEPEKHLKILEDMHNHANGKGLEEPKKTMGVKLASHLKDGKHEDAAELMQDHPLVGSVGKTHLKSIIGSLGSSLMTNEPNPESFRSSVDYIHSAIKGQDRLKSKAASLLNPKATDQLKPDNRAREALKEHLKSVEEDPSQLLNVGGNLGHYMPEEATKLGALAARSTEYLNSIKPKNQQMASLDRFIPPSKSEMAAFDRQVDIAQQPLLVLQHAERGTLLPQDLTTLQAIYPELHNSIVDEVGEELINAKTKGIEIPYKRKQSLSLLLGQPLDSTMTPQSMQAIMKSAGPQQMQQQAKGPQKKASGVELKQLNKVDEMSETTLEARQINRNRK